MIFQKYVPGTGYRANECMNNFESQNQNTESFLSLPGTSLWKIELALGYAL